MTKIRRRFFPMRGYSIYTAVVVPSTRDVDKPVPKREFFKRVREVKGFMTKEFGGSTVLRGRGEYKSQEAKKGVVREKVAIVESFTKPKTWEKDKGDVRTFLGNEAKKWGQESVGFEFSSPRKSKRMIFISGEKK